MHDLLEQNGKASLSPSTFSTPSSGRRTMLSPNTMSPLSQNEDISNSNIVFIPSSDEEDIQKRRRLSKKVNVKTASSYKTALKSNMAMATEEEGLVGRMLSFKPSPKIQGMKIPKTEGMKPPKMELSLYGNKSAFKLRSEKMKAVLHPKPTGHTLSKVNYFLNISALSITYLTSKVHFPSILLCSS